MDYALQFYRHLVEQHGTTPEAQEAREGLFRIAEWRWGEARVARGREAGGTPAPAGQNAQTPPATPGAAAGQPARLQCRRHPAPAVWLSRRSAAGSRRASDQAAAGRRARAGRRGLAALPAGFSVAKFCANALSGFGWITLLGGAGAAVAGFGGFVGELSAIGPLGMPLGVLLGVPLAVVGLILVVAGQLACRGVPERQRAAGTGCHRARPHQLLSCASSARLFETRHDIDEIAGPVAAVELPLEDAVPRVLAGPRRARAGRICRCRWRCRRRRATEWSTSRRSGTTACGR